MEGMNAFDLVVIGGGPAGCAAAIAAARRGARVAILERGRYPRHKVCGEFVSTESLGLLEEIAGHAPALRRLLAEAPRIAECRIFLDGRRFTVPIGLPAISIPRYEFDAALWAAAEALGVECRQQAAVEQIEGAGPFTVHSWAGDFVARALVQATGRWSNLSRANGAHPSDSRWLGLKAHYEEACPAPSVDLYFFEGGYCGVQPVAPERVNVCAMVRSRAAKTLTDVFALNAELRERGRGWKQAMDVVSTSPLIFRKPTPLEGNVLLVGDAAGFVDPFVGDGISLALRSGVLAAEALATETPLREQARAYAARYRASLLPVFSASSQLRRLVAMPAVLRRPIARLLERLAMADVIVRRTRLLPSRSS